MEKDIIERLYDISERPDCEYSTVLYDAVTEIEHLRREIERLRAAWEPERSADRAALAQEKPNE
jgi:hypothetical protein